jgi:hypothetical protein
LSVFAEGVLPLEVPLEKHHLSRLPAHTVGNGPASALRLG